MIATKATNKRNDKKSLDASRIAANLQRLFDSCGRLAAVRQQTDKFRFTIRRRLHEWHVRRMKYVENVQLAMDALARIERYNLINSKIIKRRASRTQPPQQLAVRIANANAKKSYDNQCKSI